MVLLREQKLQADLTGFSLVRMHLSREQTALLICTVARCPVCVLVMGYKQRRRERGHTGGVATKAQTRFNITFLLLMTIHSGVGAHSDISCPLIFSRTHRTNIPESEDPRLLRGGREGGRYTLVLSREVTLGLPVVPSGTNSCTLWY